MRATTILICLSLATCFWGCSPGDVSPPEGYYRVDVERIADGNELAIIRLNMVFNGSRSVKVFKEGENGAMARIDPDTGNQFARCDVLLVADPIELEGKRNGKWLHQICGRNTIASFSSTYPVGDGHSLSDIMRVDITPGVYAFSSEIPIVTFHGQELRMKVQ